MLFAVIMIASASDCSTEGPGTTEIATVAAVQVSTTPLASVSPVTASASDCSAEEPGTVPVTTASEIVEVAALAVQVSTTPLASVSQVHAGSMDTTEIPTAAVTGTGMMSATEARSNATQNAVLKQFKRELVAILDECQALHNNMQDLHCTTTCRICV